MALKLTLLITTFIAAFAGLAQPLCAANLHPLGGIESFTLDTPIDSQTTDHLTNQLWDQLPGADALATSPKSEWFPTGAHEYPIKPECHPQIFAESLIENRNADLQTELRRYFTNCDDALSNYGTSGLGALMKWNELSYAHLSNPNVKNFTARFRNGEVTQGFVAIKPGSKKRPFVIVKCGVTCRGSGGSNTFSTLMVFFDEAPFNLVVLGSHTAGNNAKENRRVSAGGFYEGQEIFEFAHWLRKESPYKDTVSSVHVFGDSLGGHAALYAALYQEYTPNPDGSRTINSIMPYCPAVNLQETIVDIFTNGGLVGSYFAGKMWQIIQEAYDDVPDLHDLVQKNREPNKREYPRIVSISAARYLARLDPGLFPLPFRGQAVDTPDKYWAANRFLDYSTDLETPTFVWASKDDILVKNNLNGGLLQEKHDKVIKKNLVVLNVEKGAHCAKSVSYGWQTISAILRAYVIRNSPELLDEREKHRANVDFGRARFNDVNATRGHVGQEWVAETGKNQFKINFKQFNKKSGCRDAYSSELETCYNTTTLTLDFAKLPFRVATPSNDAEAQALSRWANAQWTILDINGDRLLGSLNQPAKIGWVTYH